MKLIPEVFLTQELLDNSGSTIKIIDSSYKDEAYELANKRCIATLLNCFYRETLASGQYIRILNKKEVVDIFPKINYTLISHHNLWMYLNLVSIDVEILIAIKQDSKIGFCHYESAPYVKKADEVWQPIAWDKLSFFLIKELSISHQLPFNDDLLEQIKNSVQVMTAGLDYYLQSNKESIEELSFIDSEQLLLFGHSFHPSPKSREGMTSDDIRNFSPELKANFSLHYFLVRNEFLIHESLSDISAVDIIQQNASWYFRENDGYTLICTHPWQACYLNKLSCVQKNMAAKNIYDLGLQGERYYPTSSIRTVYHPHNPFFYKFSLNVRITNCVRKNAIYELKTAICLTKILSSTDIRRHHKFPDFHVLLEPAFLSIDLPGGSKEERKQVTEGFGVIFRQTIQTDPGGPVPILAGTLFSPSLSGHSYISQIILNLAHRLQINYDVAAIKWFDAYIEKILYPLLDYHFNLGITFEPHLQNILIGIYEDMPTCIYIRDLEGTKLNRADSSLTYFSELNEEALKSLHYSEQLAWNRVAYCLLVNNIGEAIFYIANADVKFENALWDIVRHHLCSFQEKYGNEHSKRRILGLISTEPLPIKANFMTRFLKKADKGAVYYDLVDHPLQVKNRVSI